MSDAAEICGLINYYAERGRMLHRSLEHIYDSLREFQVAEENGRVIGCIALDIFWANLAEIKSLAVDKDFTGKGIGAALVAAAVADARKMGISRLFALTYEKDFFVKQGFEVIDRQTLPEKVWRECISCPKADACDETAVMLQIDKPSRDS